MKKIPTLFVRDYTQRIDGVNPMTPEVNSGCEWVLGGEGVATRKWDGLAVMHRDGQWFKRYDAKAFTIDKTTGQKRVYDRKPPESFEPLQDPDPETGHWPGWIKCSIDDSADKLLFDTIAMYSENHLENGTYELVGPKIGTRGGANPENLDKHIIVRHGADALDAPRTFDGLRSFLESNDIEGIVWHRENGDMVKIKARDFGIQRGAKVKV